MATMESREKWKKMLPQFFLWGFICVSVFILLTLCRDNGIDFDEAYSYRAATDHDHLWQIGARIIMDYDTDIPLYYMALRVWTWIFGETFFACRLFSLAGTVASLILGATVIRKRWGSLTAFLYMLPVALGPTMVHVGVNIRMYSWTVFLITACGLVVHTLVQKPEKGKSWLLLFVLTETSLFCHYFTAFFHLFLYLYLIGGLFAAGQRKHIWKAVVSGGVAVIPFVVWTFASGILHLASSEGRMVDASRIHFGDMLAYVFQTDIRYSLILGTLLLGTAVVAAIALWKRFGGWECSFALLCLLCFPAAYIVAGGVASLMEHFFIARHVMHGMGLLWLGIAIIIPRINIRTYLSVALLVLMLCGTAYRQEYVYAYNNIPNLDATVQFIADRMEAGDIVLYNAEPKYDLLYGCYMPEQIFYHYSEVELSELAGQTVWCFWCTPDWFSEEELAGYQITRESMGHFGFQIITYCTDFDILRLTIDKAGE